MSKHFVVLLKLYRNSLEMFIKLHKTYLYIVSFVFVFKSSVTLVGSIHYFFFNADMISGISTKGWECSFFIYM